MKKIPDLEAWAIFAKAAETGSFVQTAEAFSISQPTVSKAINRLETRMKTMLFHRTPRRLSLTESGFAALERASRILAEGEAVEAEVAEQSDNPCGLVRISAPVSFGIKHLSPVLPKFMSEHPDINLDIEFNDELVDLVANRFDVALRISHLADSSLLARRLCPVRILLVGAPTYLERYGRPTHPRELSEHSVLHYSYSQSGLGWRFRHMRHGEFTQTITSPLRINNAEGLTPPLLAGLGLALQPEFLVANYLKTGQLEIVMDEWFIDPIALYIVTPPGRRRPARVQVLIDYFVKCYSSQSWDA